MQEKQQQSFLFRSLQTKITFFLVFLTTLILIFFSVYQIFKIKQELDRELVITNQNTAERLANHIELAMWTLDKASVTQSVRSEFLNQDISAIAVNLAETGFYVGLHRDAAGEIAEINDEAMIEQLRSQAKIVTSSKRIAHKGAGLLGEVYAFSTKQFNDERIKQQYLNQALIIMFIGLALIAVTFIVLQLFMIKPITKVSAIARKMSQGKYLENLKAQSNDEIGELYTALNMLNKSYQIARTEVKSMQN